MTRAPWKDALVRAQRAAPRAEAANPVAVPNPAPRPQPGQIAAAAPGLQPLLDERRALEERIQRLVGATSSDPRYNVEPLDQRRAALAAWGEERDAGRAQRRRQGPAPAAEALPLRGTAADFLRATSAEQLRGTSADQLRATPAELLPELRPSRAGDRFDRTSGRDVADDGLALRDLMRALDMPRNEPGAAQPRRRRGTTDTEGADAARASPAAPQTREADAGDALERRLGRARAMAARARRALDGADRALDHARDAIPADWRRRAEERIPGLGRADGYVRDTARKLSVLVGTIEEIGQKADRLRSMARDMREVKEADEANDEARRERALDRLRARRQED
jgi:hypothetical protein